MQYVRERRERQTIVNRTNALAVVTASSPLTFVVFSAVATLLAVDYDSKSSTLSMLAGPGMQHAWVFQVGVGVHSLLVQPLGLLLYRQAHRVWQGAAMWALVLLYGLFGTVTAIFRDGFDTRLFGLAANEIHDFAARLAFLALLSLMFISPVLVSRQKYWRSWGYFSAGSAAITLVLSMPFFFDVFGIPLWWGVLGFMQRGFVAVTMAWLFVTAIKLGLESSRSRNVA